MMRSKKIEGGKKIEIRYDNPKTKEEFKEIAAHFQNYEETLTELIKIYKTPGRIIPHSLPGGIIHEQHPSKS